MMIITFINKFIIHYYLIILFVFLLQVESIEVDIKNTEDEMVNLYKKINSEYQNGNQLILNFNENYYLLKNEGSNDITVETNIYFKGNKNMTIFDFSKGEYTNIKFYINSDQKKIIYFENIIFKNFNKAIPFETEFSLMFKTNTNNYQVHFNNCIFENNNLPVLSGYSTIQKTNDLHQFIFDNCIFK